MLLKPVLPAVTCRPPTSGVTLAAGAAVTRDRDQPSPLVFPSPLAVCLANSSGHCTPPVGHCTPTPAGCSDLCLPPGSAAFLPLPRPWGFSQTLLFYFADGGMRAQGMGPNKSAELLSPLTLTVVLTLWLLRLIPLDGGLSQEALQSLLQSESLLIPPSTRQT